MTSSESQDRTKADDVNEQMHLEQLMKDQEICHLFIEEYKDCVGECLLIGER